MYKLLKACLLYIVSLFSCLSAYIGLAFMIPAKLILRYYGDIQSETESENTENVSNNDFNEES